jgi:hypothetical protein
VALDESDRSRVFADNLARFIRHHLSRHGQLAAVARELDVEPSKLRRYAGRKGSSRELRDIEFIHQLLGALGFDPITVFSAAQRAESLAMLLALAEGSLAHNLSAEFLRLAPGLGGHPGVQAPRGIPDRRDLEIDVA